MTQTRFLLFFLTLQGLIACKSSQPARPAEYYDNTSLEPEPSTILIPIKIHRNELQQDLNQRIGKLLYEDKNLADDGLMIRATRKEDITVQVESQQIRYRAPLDLWVKKDIGITEVEAEGSIALEFVTRYNVKPDWTLETVTDLNTYKWMKEPVIKLGFGNLPVTAIANALLNNSKKDLAQTIDDELKASFDLRKEMEIAWKEMQEPFLLSEEYKAWLILNPLSIGMSPLTVSGNVIQSTIAVNAKPKMALGEKPTPDRSGKLPDFQVAQTIGEQFTIFISTEVPFREAERISKQNLVGETFTQGKKSVKVEDIELFGQGNKLVVNTKLSGSYNGSVYFTGKPEYHEKKNKVELSQVDFDFDTRQKLLKTAGWLFKGTLKKKVQESLNFYLNYNLEETKSLIQQELQEYKLSPGITLHGLLENLDVSHVHITSESLRVRIGLKGKIDLDVKGL
jgi:hypothetical protein